MSFFDTDASIDEKIDHMLTLGEEACSQSQLRPSLAELQEFGKHLNISVANKSKSTLVRDVFYYRTTRLEIENGTLKDSHRSTSNTFPRLCNFLMKSPDALR